jgi:Domain of unknown function (DUF4276)
MAVTPVVHCIVEGYGEVLAVPELVRRVGRGLTPPVFPVVSQPIRVPRSRLVRGPDEFGRAVRLGTLKQGGRGGVLVVLDADDDCPVDLAKTILSWGRDIAPSTAVSVVVANREFESWFLAGIESLRGRRGIHPDAVVPSDCENIRDAKGRLNALMVGETYSPVTHQPSFAATLDLSVAARRNRSLRKLIAEVKRLLGPA